MNDMSALVESTLTDDLDFFLVRTSPTILTTVVLVVTATTTTTTVIVKCKNTYD